MAVTFLKRSTLPAPVKGKVGSLSVVVGGNGQVTLSSMSTKALNGSKHVTLGFDAGKVYLFLDTAKVVAKVDDKDKILLNHPKKGGTTIFAGSAILKDAATFGSHIYDYKASGNQTFAVSVDEKNGCLTFDLPKGSMTPKPITKRAKKAKSPNGVAATPDSPMALPEPELELTLN